MKCRETMLDVRLWIPMSCTAPYPVRTLTEQSSKVIGLKYERCCLYNGTFERYFYPRSWHSIENEIHDLQLAI